jgi:hypothetical protein
VGVRTDAGDARSIPPIILHKLESIGEVDEGQMDKQSNRITTRRGGDIEPNLHRLIAYPKPMSLGWPIQLTTRTSVGDS